MITQGRIWCDYGLTLGQRSTVSVNRVAWYSKRPGPGGPALRDASVGITMGELPVEQVIRRERFEREHPEVTITYDSWRLLHRAVIIEKDGEREVIESDLRVLLDHLERLV